MAATTREDDNGGEGSAWQTLAPLMDLVTPMAVRVAATLRLADLIAGEGTDIAQLAERSGTDSDALARMLRHLVCRGLFTEPRPGVFALNDAATLLRSGHPSGMRRWLDLDGFGGQMDLAFTGLLHTVRTGRPAWETVFGAPFWSYLDANPAMSASFDATMAADPEYVVDAASGYDWAGARRIVDVGGGRGALVAEILRAHPALRATLVDLPDTVERGRRHLAEQALDGRCDFAAQSFFDPLPTGGDVYVLSGVLHDWDDEHATAILRGCAQAIDEGGRVVVISHGTSGDAPAMFAEMNLRMLVLCGGRERTVDEYASLAAGVGLGVASVRSTPLDSTIIECRILGDDQDHSGPGPVDASVQPARHRQFTAAR